MDSVSKSRIYAAQEVAEAVAVAEVLALVSYPLMRPAPRQQGKGLSYVAKLGHKSKPIKKVSLWYPEEVLHIGCPPNDFLSALWADWLVKARPEVHVNNICLGYRTQC